MKYVLSFDFQFFNAVKAFFLIFCLEKCFYAVVQSFLLSSTIFPCLFLLPISINSTFTISCTAHHNAQRNVGFLRNLVFAVDRARYMVDCAIRVNSWNTSGCKCVPTFFTAGITINNYELGF